VIGKREFEGASCWIRMMTDLPMQLRDGVRLVHNLKTDKGMRGKGQGTELLRRICAEADREGVTLILMPDNELLQKWYSKVQFSVVQTEPSVLMVRPPSEMETQENGRTRTRSL
jgi:ribosomal protein S18 acetylase RimI-like enzyme